MYEDKEQLKVYVESAQTIIKNENAKCVLDCSRCPTKNFLGTEMTCCADLFGGSHLKNELYTKNKKEWFKKWLTKYGKGSELYIKSTKVIRYE